MRDISDTDDTIEVFGGEDDLLNDAADEQDEIEEQHAKNTKSSAVNPVGRTLYGEAFERFQKLDEYKHLLPAFKEHYYKCRIENPKCTVSSITKSFNEAIAHEEIGFYPYPNAMRNWRKKWDKDILEKKGMKMEVITTKRNIQQVLKTRNAEEGGVVEYGTPSYESLEETLQTFGGELLNDAMQQLRNDQENEEMFESDELIRRKSYGLQVFSHVTKMVHGKAAILLKASQEKRENANFLMDLMKKGTSGEITVEDIQALKATYAPTNKENHVVESVA